MVDQDITDYESLRIILERELGRTVTIEEATKTGKLLVKVYDILLSDEPTGLYN